MRRLTVREATLNEVGFKCVIRNRESNPPLKKNNKSINFTPKVSGELKP